ncbi:MFS multidrug transporter-like protein [Neofusicoccum parvum]|uniref:MFS multidrug transporter-like protein n=1 Tax=Neofusicoccum parvum TaxID=310453 RepID=A0ACB5SET0_9PEZI|nr:MFS multidrug transporter-like protein [Neofusicoccum parvum]
MEKDLNTSNTIGVMILSIYMLAFSVGPLITSPLSEMYDRLVVLQGSNAFFLIFNTACGFAKTPGQLLAFRFLSGIGGAVMGEMFTPLERGQAVSIYSIAPLLGPVVGPDCGGLLAQHAWLLWRWLAGSRAPSWCGSGVRK